MSDVDKDNPAEIAAQKALQEMFDCIDKRQHFRLEAGAGAGKTYSLVKALNFVIEKQGITLQRRNEKVACITYTNVATDEIISRIDGNPIVFVSTIHSFCWDLIKSFQPALRTGLGNIKQWTKLLQDSGGISKREVYYDLGYRYVNDTHAFLHHDDVLILAIKMLEFSKFRRIIGNRYPILFIDEYQDTNIDFADSILQHFIKIESGILIGLFGDSWQKIYRDGKGVIDDPNLYEIGKGANFRSVSNIVKVLNKIRPDLLQEVKCPDAVGTVAVYHSNDWIGERRSGNHWAGDLPDAVAHDYLLKLREYLCGEEWDFAPSETKILMLTHKVLAEEQNYAQIVDVFKYSDAFLKKEDAHIAFLIDTIEPACIAYQNGRYGDMFTAIGIGTKSILKHDDKLNWAKDMKALMKLRETGTIGEVLEFIKENRGSILPDKINDIEVKLDSMTQEEIQGIATLSQINQLREVPYTQLISLALFVNNHTPFSTKHGVKGAEFENVLVVLGRGWNLYNWNQFLEWFPDKYPINKQDSYIRNRNLFYVACSRPKRRLALLFTQKLSDEALTALNVIFGQENIHSISGIE